MRGESAPLPTPRLTPVRLYDTQTREVRDFVPLEAGQAGIYVCGLTVQSEPHVGHVRSAVNFDVLRRWLTYQGYSVTFIRNVTDIDDKILAKAVDQGRPWFEIAYLMGRELEKALEAINVLPPTYQPAATGHVPEIVELITQLIERGHAYAAPDGSGDVYFDVRSWPAYGELTRQGVDDMEPAEDADPRGKRDPRDFALWKGWKKESEPETAAWPSPWGRGRPGWHIECSAMAGKYLGAAFDIHGGGVDLRFPHHENEQAQSRAAGHPFASYWMHNAWITTAGEKMSKSLGNSLLIPSVLQRVRGIELRFYIVAAHYRSHVEFSFEALDEAAQGFRRIENFLERAGGTAVASDLPDAFYAAMDDDLGTPAAVAVLYDTVRQGNSALAAESLTAAQLAASVRAMLGVLGLDPADPAWPSPGGGTTTKLTSAVDTLVAGLLEQRAQARAAKDFAAADAIRDTIKAAGIEVEDTPQARSGHLRQWPATAVARARSGSPARDRPSGPAGRCAAGSRARGPRRRPRTGPTTRPTRRRRRPRRSPRTKPRRRTGGDAEWVAGRNAVVEALREGVPVTGLYVAEGAERDGRLREAFKIAAEDGISLMEVGRGELDRMTGGAVHQGLAARIPAYEYAHPDDLLDRAEELGEKPLIVALDQVTDPRNLGATVRSAAAFGAHGVVVAERRAAGMTAAAWKSSAGAAARIPVARASNLVRALKDYQEAGCMVVGLAADGDVDLTGFELADGPLVLVVGSEGGGLSRLVAETCDQLLSIPMANQVESLNAGVAAGVALYAVACTRA